MKIRYLASNCGDIFLTSQHKDLTSQHKNLTRRHKDLTSQHNYPTSDGRSMPPYYLDRVWLLEHNNSWCNNNKNTVIIKGKTPEQ